MAWTSVSQNCLHIGITWETWLPQGEVWSRWSGLWPRPWEGLSRAAEVENHRLKPCRQMALWAWPGDSVMSWQTQALPNFLLSHSQCLHPDTDGCCGSKHQVFQHSWKREVKTTCLSLVLLGKLSREIPPCPLSLRRFFLISMARTLLDQLPVKKNGFYQLPVAITKQNEGSIELSKKGDDC